MKFIVAVSSLLASQALGFFAFDNNDAGAAAAAPIIHQMPVQQEAEPSYNQAYGAMHKTQNEASEAAGPGLRSTGNSNNFKTVEDVIQQAIDMRMIPEADEQAQLRHCLTKRAHKFPEKQAFWDSLRMYLASDWFKLWGYQCGGDYKCWKMVLANFPQFNKAQAKDISRCVMKLVRDRKNGRK